MIKAFNDKQYDTALKNAQSILNKNYIDIDSHLVSQAIYKEMNNSDKSDFHGFVAAGLVKSILDSGDGKSPETAYLVIDVREEYVIMWDLGFKLERQFLMETNNHSYDKMDVIKPETGETAVLYFNVDIPLNWYIKYIKQIGSINQTP